MAGLGLILGLRQGKAEVDFAGFLPVAITFSSGETPVKIMWEPVLSLLKADQD